MAVSERVFATSANVAKPEPMHPIRDAVLEEQDFLQVCGWLAVSAQKETQQPLCCWMMPSLCSLCHVDCAFVNECVSKTSF